MHITKSTKKVLLVGADPAMLKILLSHFADKNAEFSIAISPKEALHKIETVRPDLTLLDVSVPRQSGLEMLEAIRNNQNTKDAAVFVLSVLSDEEVIQKARSLGVVDYVVKGTISLSELEDKIQSFLWPQKK